MALSGAIHTLLEHTAATIRASIIDMLIEAGSGHTAGPLGMTDIFTYLYFHHLNHRPLEPTWKDRDRVILSNGHICPVLYATMAHAGYFPVSELKTLRKFKSRLQGHPHREWLSALETSSGPLGSGLSQAVGMALAERMNNGRSSSKQIYCFTGDGELNCGQIWEAFLLAGKEKLQNLTVIVDRNNIQIDGFTEDVMPLNPLKAKFESFNFNVIEIDGHNFSDIDRGFGEAMTVFDRPTVIIAYTIPSKGIPDFERQYQWHGKAPTTNEEKRIAHEAIEHLRTLGGRIKGGHID